MDPLSDVLRAVRLNGAFFYLVEAAHPWSVAAAAARELVPRVLPDVEHLISYHILLEGSGWGGLDGEPQLRLHPGDVIVFPQGDPYFMSSVEGERVNIERVGTSPERYPGTVVLSPADGCDTRFVCGFLGCDVRPYNPLLASLPRQLLIPGIASGWLSQFPRQVVDESRAGRVASERRWGMSRRRHSAVRSSVRPACLLLHGVGCEVRCDSTDSTLTAAHGVDDG